MFFANLDHIYPPHDIHGWKATYLSLVLPPSDRNLKHPTSRQNFGDAPGQTPKLILTLCLTQKTSHCLLNPLEAAIGKDDPVTPGCNEMTTHLFSCKFLVTIIPTGLSIICNNKKIIRIVNIELLYFVKSNHAKRGALHL